MSLVEAMCGVPRNDISSSQPNFYISYNPDTRAGAFGDSDGGEETALVFEEFPHGKDGHSWTGKAFFILKGDFRKDYAAIIADKGGRWDLKQFYDSQKHRYGSRHSTDFHQWGKDGIVRRRPPSTKRNTRKPKPQKHAKD